MTRFFTTTLVLSFFALTSFAQQRVILQSNGNASVFGGASAFTDAYDAASNGDTLYLPGLQFSVPSAFDKSLTIFGTGYHPDHTEATGVTRLSGTININAGATGSHFEGIYFTHNISFAAAKIDNVTIKRCFITTGVTLNGLSDDLSDNITISECIITGTFNGRLTKNLIFENSILFHATRGMFINIRSNAWVHNNIIIGSSSDVNSIRMIFGLSDSLFENNIFYDAGGSRHFSDVSNNTFNNNVFSWNPTGDANNTWNNNFTGVNIPDIFINYTGNSFSFEADYNLVEPASYQGTTGNQVSIYGGLNPFKDNTRPSNPQILSKDIQNSTDVDGNLGVEIEVEAQDE